MALKTQAKCTLLAWALLICMSSPILFASTTYAAEAVLNIGATILQCGPRTNLVEACKEREICCAFLDSYQIADNLHRTTIEEDSYSKLQTNSPEQSSELVLE